VSANLKPWGRWSTLGLCLVALFAGQGVALATLTWGYRLSLAHWSNLILDGILVTLSVYIATIVQVGLLVLMTRRTGAGTLGYLALTMPGQRDLVLGIGSVATLGALADAVSRLFGFAVVTQFQFDIYRSASAAGWLPWLCLALVVVAPVGEETLFRGFFFRGWHRSPGDTWFAITATALLWALTHVQYQPYFMAQVFVFGLLLGWFRCKSGSTILTIVLHSLANLQSFVETIVAYHS